MRWKTAEMEIVEKGGGFTGLLHTVDGDIVNAGVVSSTFKGQRARMDRSKELLILEGAVEVHSIDPPATLYCDTVRYEADKKLIKAHGHVRLVGDMGTVSGLDEIWTTPELRQVATPDLFVTEVKR